MLHSNLIPQFLSACSCLERAEDRDLNSRELECLDDGSDMVSTENRQAEYKLLIVLTGSLDVLLFVLVSSGAAFVAGQTVNQKKVHSAVVQIND